MGDVMLNPFGLGRQSAAAAQAMTEPLLGEGAGIAAAGMGAMEGAELGAGAAGAGLGALEGAEIGVWGGPVGMPAGAAIGAVGSAALAALAFRNRESTEQQDHFARPNAERSKRERETNTAEIRYST